MSKHHPTQNAKYKSIYSVYMNNCQPSNAEKLQQKIIEHFLNLL